MNRFTKILVTTVLMVAPISSYAQTEQQALAEQQAADGFYTLAVTKAPLAEAAVNSAFAKLMLHLAADAVYAPFLVTADYPEYTDDLNTADASYEQANTKFNAAPGFFTTGEDAYAAGLFDLAAEAWSSAYNNFNEAKQNFSAAEGLYGTAKTNAETAETYFDKCLAKLTLAEGRYLNTHDAKDITSSTISNVSSHGVMLNSTYSQFEGDIGQLEIDWALLDPLYITTEDLLLYNDLMTDIGELMLAASGAITNGNGQVNSANTLFQQLVTDMNAATVDAGDYEQEFYDLTNATNGILTQGYFNAAYDYLYDVDSLITDVEALIMDIQMRMMMP